MWIRDKGCRLIRVLTAQQAITLFKNAGERAYAFDPAHVFGVGPHPHMCYMDENVVLLNRYSHDMLDSCRDPITGEPIDRETRDNWWALIVGKPLFEKLEGLSREPGEL